MRVAGQNHVPVVHQQGHVGIDDVSRSVRGEQFTGSPTGRIVERFDDDTGHCTRQVRLRGAISPDLTDNGSTRESWDSPEFGLLEEGADTRRLTFNSNECPSVEDECHR